MPQKHGSNAMPNKQRPAISYFLALLRLTKKGLHTVLAVLCTYIKTNHFMDRYFENDTQWLRAIKNARRLVLVMLVIVIATMAYTAYKTFFK